MNTHSKLYVWLSTHLAVTFALLTISFSMFAVLTLDLARLLTANGRYIISYGMAALADGGLLQLLGLIFGTIVAMSLYLVFKFCEHVLTHRLAFTSK